MQKILALCLLLFLNSCFPYSFCESITPGKCGARGAGIFAPKHYKYKCEKPGQCCEVGKDCEEDDKKLK